MNNQQYSEVLQRPSIVIDAPGTPINFKRWNGVRNVTLTGVIVGVVTSVPRRCQEVVYDYVVMPTDARYCHLSGMVVNESDITWQGNKNVCPDCGGHGYTSIRGDEAVNCERCNPMSDSEVTF